MMLDRLLNDRKIQESLRVKGGDFDRATEWLIEECRQQVRNQREQYFEDEIRHLQAQLRNSSPSERVRVLQTRVDELRQQASQMLQQSLDEEIDQAFQVYHYYVSLAAHDPIYLDQSRLSLYKWIKLRVQRELLAEIADLYFEAANRVQELLNIAEQDLRALIELGRLLESRLNRRRTDPDAIRVQWPPDELRCILRTIIRQFILRYLRQSIGALASEDLPTLLDKMLGEVMLRTPAPPALADVISERFLREFMHGLPLWQGVTSAAKLLLDPPVVFIEAPDNLNLPIVHDIQSTVWHQPNNAPLVVRVCKFVPLHAIEGWEDWLDADRLIRSDNLVVNSAEPHLADEQDQILDRVMLRDGRADKIELSDRAAANMAEPEPPA